MNFDGGQADEQHTIAGRLIPLMEALHIAVAQASGQPLIERHSSKALPEWTRSQELLTRYATTPALKLEGTQGEPAKP